MFQESRYFFYTIHAAHGNIFMFITKDAIISRQRRALVA